MRTAHMPHRATVAGPRAGKVEAPRAGGLVRRRPRAARRSRLAFWFDWAPILLLGVSALVAGILRIGAALHP